MQEIPASKTCSKCKVEKPLDEFSKRKTAPDGHRADCRACRRAYSKRYHQANREVALAQRREAYRRDPETAREYQRANREHNTETARASRARKRGAFILEEVRSLVVLELDDGVCGVCGEDVDPFDFDIDHVIPTSRGGEHSYANTQVAHRACNNRKQAEFPWDMEVAAA